MLIPHSIGTTHKGGITGKSAPPQKRLHPIGKSSNKIINFNNFFLFKAVVAPGKYPDKEFEVSII